MTKNTKKTLSTLTVLTALAFGSASAHAADDMARTRGQVSVSSAAVKAVVAGPVAIHAYSGFSGGTIFAARAVTGTDADCKAQPLAGTAQTLRADSILDFQVGAGQVACLSTSTVRPLEMLWHASKTAPVMLAAR